MAFFTKLKDRLFKSSSKLDEGLEAIVSDGGEAEAEAAPVDAVMDQPGAASDVMPDGQEDSGPMLTAEREAEEPTPRLNLPRNPSLRRSQSPSRSLRLNRSPNRLSPSRTPHPCRTPAADPEPAPAPEEVPAATDLRQAMTPVAPALDETPAEAAAAKPGLWAVSWGAVPHSPWCAGRWMTRCSNSSKSC